jgi:hypothetical protein
LKYLRSWFCIFLIKKEINPMIAKNPKKGSKKTYRSFNPKRMSIEFADALKLDLQSAGTMMAGNEVAALYRDTQIEKFLSKFSLLTDDTADLLEEEAFEKFFKCNETMAQVNLHFQCMVDDDPVAFPQSDERVKLVLRRARALAHYVLTPLSEDEYFYGCKSSIGSSIGVPYSNTAPERKYLYPISVSDKRLAPLWHRYMLFNPEFALAIANLNEHNPKDMFEEVGASRATTVEKSANSRRMIAVEPVVNMFFQQGLMSALVRRLKVVGIDLARVPDKHVYLAWVNSLTASLDTIDFSSASDCVSAGFLRWLIPVKWYSAISLVRCPEMKIKGNNIPLEMISTMGNATTFPIETLVFWCIAVSSAMTVAEPQSKSLLPNENYFGSCSVFGDDCITPSSVTALFMAATKAVGFTINMDKSFFDGGYFRESCGGDFYRGYNVRPVYLRAPTNNKLSSLEPWLYALMNRIIPKYISYFGSLQYVYGRALFEAVFAIFRKERLLVKVVPDWFPDDAGLKIGGDLFRFQRAYDFRCSKLSRSDQGVWQFNYCRFQYRYKEDHHSHLRYCLMKKQYLGTLSSLLSYEEDNLFVTFDNLDYSKEMPFRFLRKESLKTRHRYNVRKLGGYVVASAVTAHWSPNVAAVTVTG